MCCTMALGAPCMISWHFWEIHDVSEACQGILRAFQGSREVSKGFRDDSRVFVGFQE